MSGFDETFDLVIVGSGGGSMCAALKAKELGKRALIIEKLDKVGGSTGYSGGVWWVPNNPVMKRHGVEDSYEKAALYMNSTVTYEGVCTAPARREAFLRTGPVMVDFLERAGMQFVYADGWADYYDDRPGGQTRGRSLVAKLFNINELGEWTKRLSIYRGPELPATSNEFPTLFLASRTWAGKRKALALAGRFIKNKLTGKRVLGGGAAIQGRMLQIALREKLPIWINSPLEELIVENNRVIGVVVKRDGKTVRVKANDGVLLVSGGFSRNAKMRQEFQPQPITADWTNANLGDTGEVMQMAMDLGAAVDCMDESWWVLTSMGPNYSWPEGAWTAEGQPLPFMHHLDLSLPYSMMVDQDGQRFCNEAGSYMEIGQRMFKRQAETGKAVPAWVVMDSRQRKNYPWGTAMPGKVPQSWLDSGYMIKADTLEELAQKCAIDQQGLLATVKRFNGFCAAGVDEDFARGGKGFDQCHGDPTHKPNPNLGSIEQGPFYAVRMYPGDVGTAGGLVTDECARVLREDGSCIDGLYAAGNVTAGVTGRAYPGAGTSITASFAFGYIAAMHSAGHNRFW